MCKIRAPLVRQYIISTHNGGKIEQRKEKSTRRPTKRKKKRKEKP